MTTLYPGRIFMFITSFCLMFNYLFSQNHPAIDSLLILIQEAKDDTNKINILNDLSRQYNNTGNYQSALEYAGQAKQLSEQLNFKKGLAASYNNAGNICDNLGNYREALNNYLNALKIWRAAGDKKGMASSYIGIGNISMIQGNYEKALDSYLNSLKIWEEIDNKQGISNSYNNIGLLYENQHNYEKALDFHLKSLEIKKSIGDTKGMAKSYNNIGNLYKELGDYQDALEYYSKSLKIKEEIGNKQGVANTYYNIGNIYIEQKNLKKALESHVQSLKISEELGDKQIMANSLNSIGLIYLDLENINQSYQHLVRALELNIETGYREGIKDTYSLLSKYYEKKQDYKQALKYRNLYSAVNDTLLGEQSSKHMAEMQTKYETEKKEKENELLKKENEINELVIQKEKAYQKFLWGGIVSLSFFLIIVIYLFVIIRKTNRQLKIQQKELITTNNKLVESENELTEALATKDKFFSIISHDLRGPFISVKLFNDYLKENIHAISKEEFMRLTDEHDNAVSRINNLLENLLLWAKTQTGRIVLQRELLSLKRIIENNLQLFNPVAMNKKINLHCDIADNTNISFDKNMLEAIIRNLLSNAIKYTHSGGKISVKAVGNKNEIIVEVNDTGTGIKKGEELNIFSIDRGYIKEGTDGEKGSGLGLILCREFVELNGGSIWVESEPGMGSSFKFSVPVAEKEA